MTITFVGPAISRFVQNDIAILERSHSLSIIDSAMGRGGSAAWNLIILHFKIITSLLRSQAVFFWFADYYTLIPTLVAKLLGKRVYVVAGGFDVAFIPEVKSGARTRKGRWFMVRNTFKYATHIFPVSKYAKQMLDDAVPRHSQATVVYNAVNLTHFPYSSKPREHIALTVTQLDTILDYRLKGIDIFLQTARQMQDVKFQLVGIRGEALAHAQSEATELGNVTIKQGPVTLDELIAYYHNASAYCQLSMDESFGVATAEAMRCGCIPVVSEVPSLREVTGGTGHVVSRTDVASITEAIRATFGASDEVRKKCSDYVAQFDIDKRAEQILALVK